MTTREFIEYLLTEEQSEGAIDEKVAYEAASLVTGSFVYNLYELLWLNDLSVPAITAHLQKLYDSKENSALLYFVVLLADAIEFALPSEFFKMSVKEQIVPILSAAFIDDWLDVDNEYEEVTEE